MNLCYIFEGEEMDKEGYGEKEVFRERGRLEQRLYIYISHF